MSEFSQSPQQRAFQCPQCNGRIVIPAHLPPTTGPCPHCQATITSPEPDIYSSIIDVDPIPAVESRPVPAPAPTPVAPAPTPLPVPVPAPTQTIVEKFAEKALDKHTEESKAIVATKSDKSTKRTSPAVLIIVFLLILVCLGGGAYFAIKMLKPKNDATTSPVMPPNKPTANPTLIKYIAAPTLDEKLNFVFNAEVLRPKMEAFYKEHSIIETDALAGNFSLVKLPEMDSKKGFILLAYDQPTPKDQANPKSNPTPPRTKILAFLKETESGVKLDWEVFAQTKYRTFNKFVTSPVIGKTEVFRVIVTHTPVKDAAKAKPHVSYTFTDPAYLSDNVEISPDSKSQAGQALARLDVESTKQPGELNRTATIELTWTGDPKKPQLEIKRFICWEFLNLGGKEIAEINPSN